MGKCGEVSSPSVIGDVPEGTPFYTFFICRKKEWLRRKCPHKMAGSGLKWRGTGAVIDYICHGDRDASR